jgi:putative peptidoglycan lipid II flippase
LRQPIPLVGAPAEHVDPTTGSPPVSALLSQGASDAKEKTSDAPQDPEPGTADRARGATPLDPREKSAGVRPNLTTTLTSGSSQAARTPQPTAPPDRSGQRPRRRWIGVLVLLALLLVTAGIVSAVVLDQRLSPGARQVASGGPPGSPAPTTAAPEPIAVRGAQEFDPQGDPPTEHPDEVAFAYDGDQRTRWRTLQYLRNPKLGGIKRGVGLVFDLGAARPVHEVRLALSGKGTDVELRVPATDPAGTTKPPMTSDRDWRSVAKQSQAGATATLTASKPVTTRYVLVYLTSLPKEGQGYRGGIYEVEVR